MKNNKINIALAIGLVLMTATARIVYREMHMFNFAPIAAIGLFSGAVIKDRRLAFLVALLSQFVADMYFQLFTNTPGFYGISQLFTYGALLAVTFLGTRMNSIKALPVLGYTIAASTIFFIISNLGVYACGWWGYSFNGFTTTYIMAIPFFKNTLAGDMIGSVFLFGGYFLLKQAFTTNMQKAKA
ncbi:MAG: hypothetical protein H0X33_12505 [Taibaiella sp.]|nr:hypothetical protein [Taibaiella sp.]